MARMSEREMLRVRVRVCASKILRREMPIAEGARVRVGPIDDGRIHLGVVLRPSAGGVCILEG